MGLDMYLTKKIFVGAQYEHRNVTGKIEITIGNRPCQVDLSKVSEITESVGYWRKANAIHKWFVDNIQEGEDDCREYEVSFEQLQELKKLCKQVLKTKKFQLLPPQEGFFFGSADADEYYYQDLKKTVKIIDQLDKDGDYVYRASW
jgi:hypothetical protein